MSSYDIVFFAGEKNWDPENKSLDGSEQSIVFLSNSFSKMGKSVAVYGGFSDKKINDVDYFNFSNFSYENNYDVVIIWRLFGLSTCSLNDLKANAVRKDAQYYIDIGVRASGDGCCGNGKGLIIHGGNDSNAAGWADKNHTTRFSFRQV